MSAPPVHAPCVGCGRVDALWNSDDPAICLACYAEFALVFFDLDGQPTELAVTEGPATRVADALLSLVGMPRTPPDKI